MTEPDLRPRARMFISIRTADGKLTEFYGERTDVPGWYGKIVDGTCVSTPDTWTMSVNVPAHHLDRVAM
jgi:hypothetical protein